MHAPAAPAAEFFRAIGAPNKLGISVNPYKWRAVRPIPSQLIQATNAELWVTLDQPATKNFSAYYSMSGTAINGTDYQPMSGHVDIGAGQSLVSLEVVPKESSGTNFDVFATFTLLESSDYVVEPTKYSATVTITDNYGSNIFSVVATNLPDLCGVDYFAPSNCLVLPTYPFGSPSNFLLLHSYTNMAYWSGVSGVGDGDAEIKIATAKVTANGFTNGDLFFGNALPGGIGKVSAGGGAYAVNWASLDNELDQVQGDLYVDQTGIWGNNLLAVSGQHGAAGGDRGVWSIDATGTNKIQITRIPAEHLEGLLTLSNNPAKYGQWAGKLVTADEQQQLFWAVDTNGVAGWYNPGNLNIAADTLRLIPADVTNHALYLLDVTDPEDTRLLKLDGVWLKGYEGDILVLQSGEIGVRNTPPCGLYIIHWDNPNGRFSVKVLPLAYYFRNHCFEKAAFAPIKLPKVPGQ